MEHGMSETGHGSHGAVIATAERTARGWNCGMGLGKAQVWTIATAERTARGWNGSSALHARHGEVVLQRLKGRPEGGTGWTCIAFWGSWGIATAERTARGWNETSQVDLRSSVCERPKDGQRVEQKRFGKNAKP